MVRSLIGFMLLVIVLLLDGYPHCIHSSARFSPGKYYLNLTEEELADEPCDVLEFSKSGTPDARSSSEKIQAVELSEEDIESIFRKQHIPFKLVITALYTHTTTFSSVSPPTPLPFSPQISCTTPDKIIVQRVIRI
ncbi:hypothetical protein [Chitinophaga deserti]|uniref:hypothetical protein n=1 Tax=Chitinophaga deserti TaxID=2164099 RepID=UPI001300A833|nr:hypothetical protein [Chitinophaga deserti]